MFDELGRELTTSANKIDALDAQGRRHEQMAAQYQQEKQGAMTREVVTG